jgi:5-hydroxyisourate hydrolase-like protein (transthyretin family)
MITQDGVPLADASVEFVPAESSQSKYRAVTQTDESGTSQMSTYGHSGVPAGKYKVVVTKKEDGEPDRYFKDESTGEQKPIGWKAYRLVEPKFSSAETTPHEIEIIGKKVTATFDVGKAIRVLIE